MSGGADEERPRNQPSYNNTNSSWTDVEGWINRATKAQNQEYLKNAGRAYNTAETIDQIETYILTTAFGSVGFVSFNKCLLISKRCIFISEWCKEMLFDCQLKILVQPRLSFHSCKNQKKNGETCSIENY
jgi:hypothetical protein